VIADIVEQAVSRWGINVLIISHVREILQQDYDTINELTDISPGLYSAGLNSRTTDQVSVAGIQSIYKNPSLFNDVKLIIIDEAHLIPPKEEGMYRTFLKEFSNVACVGLTATKYRLGVGYIYGQSDSFFDDLIYDYTSYDKFNELIDRGFLCPPRTLATKMNFDVKGIRTVAGDFASGDLSRAFDRDRVTRALIDEVIRVGEDYKKWLLFAIDINHADHMAEYLIRSGIRANVVHSKMDGDREKILRQHEEGYYKAIVSVNALTTGYNSKQVDLIVCGRSTKSPVYHVQMVGRGTRIFPGKTHFGVMDFAGNTQRLGPINDVVVARKREKTGGAPITKKCPACGAIHHPRVTHCHCGHEFKFKHGLDDATNVQILRRDTFWTEVSKVDYKIYRKLGRPPSLVVTYHTLDGLEAKEWVCLEHSGYARLMAARWIELRLGKNSINTVDELYAVREDLDVPVGILIKQEKRFNTVCDYKFN
jgi:DNA repair protein RadD